ncbi:DUF4435 domain-containing protein [Chryseobacterium caseinilyticum]|uniref:DUF4435 domain-containing protein n=1 Tax=Chryseobacterium caseinilyticum TaxID=2771428 RepID=A0ABR8ZF06_9FLAO|nr:DUF4435 domain-containing protein [Chryseobacterium caseinilyticum]MBD8083866.1 DUF4435 domain-containing protein [Chryseobacterium caseinilyticum]
MTKELFFAKKEAIIPKARYFILKQIYTSSAKDVHVFTEDDDDYEFYRTSITRIYTDYNHHKYLMKGKSNLLEVYQLIDWTRYSKSKLLFFADKDYDDIIGVKMTLEPNLFYTKYYSIENYLVTEEVFLIILDRFYVNDISKELQNKLLDLYRNSYEKFIIKLRTVTWFILIDRLLSKKAVLEELKLQHLIYFEMMQFCEKKLVTKEMYERIMRSDDSLRKLQIRDATLKEILVNKCGAVKSEYHFENIMRTRDLIMRISNHKFFLRGKYDLWFLIEILKTVDKTIENIFTTEGIERSQENPIPRKKLDITTLNIFDLVCSKMTQPADILNFLTTNYTALNANNKINI